MEIFRWIIYIPAFVLYVFLAEALAGMAIYWAWGASLEAGSLTIGFYWAIIAFTLFFYYMFAITTLMIAPNGVTSMLLLFNLVLVAYIFYYVKFFDMIGKVSWILDGLTFIAVSSVLSHRLKRRA
jgi:hypothetical protein